MNQNIIPIKPITEELQFVKYNKDNEEYILKILNQNKNIEAEFIIPFFNYGDKKSFFKIGTDYQPISDDEVKNKIKGEMKFLLRIVDEYLENKRMNNKNTEIKKISNILYKETSLQELLQQYKKLIDYYNDNIKSTNPSKIADKIAIILDHYKDDDSEYAKIIKEKVLYFKNKPLSDNNLTKLSEILKVFTTKKLKKQTSSKNEKGLEVIKSELVSNLTKSQQNVEEELKELKSILSSLEASPDSPEKNAIKQRIKELESNIPIIIKEKNNIQAQTTNSTFQQLVPQSSSSNVSQIKNISNQKIQLNLNNPKIIEALKYLEIPQENYNNLTNSIISKYFRQKSLQTSPNKPSGSNAQQQKTVFYRDFLKSLPKETQIQQLSPTQTPLLLTASNISSTNYKPNIIIPKTSKSNAPTISSTISSTTSQSNSPTVSSIISQQNNKKTSQARKNIKKEDVERMLNEGKSFEDIKKFYKIEHPLASENTINKILKSIISEKPELQKIFEEKMPKSEKQTINIIKQTGITNNNSYNWENTSGPTFARDTKGQQPLKPQNWDMVSWGDDVRFKIGNNVYRKKNGKLKIRRSKKQ